MGTNEEAEDLTGQRAPMASSRSGHHISKVCTVECENFYASFNLQKSVASCHFPRFTDALHVQRGTIHVFRMLSERGGYSTVNSKIVYFW